MKSERINNLLSYVFICLSAVVLAFVYRLFIVNNNFAPAGLNGVATMVQYKTGFSIAYMSLVINVPLCVFAYFFVGKTFAKRSMSFCIVYSAVYLYSQKMDLDELQYNANGHDTIYPVILSGVIAGAVYGICFKNNSSTGGTDIVSKYISKIMPEFNFIKITFALNAAVAIASFFVYAEPAGNGKYNYDYKPVCLCLLYCFISTFVGDYILKGTKKAYEFTVITTHEDEIVKDISEKLKHSATKITARGSYSNGKKSMLICIVNRHQIMELKNILSRYDDTFSFSETVSEVYGNFKHIK